MSLIARTTPSLFGVTQSGSDRVTRQISPSVSRTCKQAYRTSIPEDRRILQERRSLSRRELLSIRVTVPCTLQIPGTIACFVSGSLYLNPDALFPTQFSARPTSTQRRQPLF